MIYSFETLKHEISGVLDNWFIFRFSTYLLLKENTNYRMLEQKFPQFIDNHFEEVLTATGGKIRLMLQPLTQIHLHSRFTSSQDSDSDILYVYLFSGIAVFILLIACINFINLTVARATTRTKEVGVRKTFGAGKSKLIQQFLIESLLSSFIAMTMAGILIEISLPLFNSLAGRSLNLNYFQKPELLAGQFLLALIVGILAGAYPAFFMSAFQPLRVMKHNLTTGSRYVQTRQILVVFQFVIAVAMIIGSITVYRQIEYIQSHKFTFEKERIVVMPSMSHEMRASFKSTVEELKRIPGIVEVAAASTIPGRGLEKSVMQPEGIPPDQPQTMNILSVDPNFIPVLGLKIIEGRNFSADLVTDREQAVIINEKAARQFGWANPLGKTFRIDSDPGENETSHFKTVVGVIQDFHLTSMRNIIEPLYIDCETGNLDNLMLKVDMVNLPLTLEQLKKDWKELNPRQGFHYFFLDETFDRLYRAEMRLSKLVLYFTILAIFIGGMGLYAISTFAATRRTKEIGVRKVLGATKSGIVTLLSGEFLLLVIIAILLAWPIAYYGLDKWLQGYAYHISLNWGTFLIAGFLALLISLVTVSFQALKAASTDPVKSLRYE
jgi:putative ABC transport system permease protein